MLRKQSSLGHAYDSSSYKSKNIDFAQECHSILQLSENGCHSEASQLSTNVNVNPFLISNPSSQTSSPQQFCNPKCDNLNLPIADSEMGHT